jgi:hypothetical protein
MTKREMQREENRKVLEFYEANRQDLETYAMYQSRLGNCSRLRNCTAWVIDFCGMWVLRSYNTIVAVIDKDGTLYDFLRYVYGYTASSAKQISKFAEDYGAVRSLTYKAI